LLGYTLLNWATKNAADDGSELPPFAAAFVRQLRRVRHLAELGQSDDAMAAAIKVKHEDGS
jgi:hypothetical protein